MITVSEPYSGVRTHVFLCVHLALINAIFPVKMNPTSTLELESGRTGGQKRRPRTFPGLKYYLVYTWKLPISGWGVDVVLSLRKQDQPESFGFLLLTELGNRYNELLQIHKIDNTSAAACPSVLCISFVV